MIWRIGRSSMYYTFSINGTNINVMIPFESHIERVRELINKVEEGKEIKDSELKGLTH